MLIAHLLHVGGGVPFTSSLSLLTWSAALCEATLSYMDNVNELGEDEKDILVTDELCRDFEATSGAILNRNPKTVIFGLSSWLGPQGVASSLALGCGPGQGV
jgi:hypothetical protein